MLLDMSNNVFDATFSLPERDFLTLDEHFGSIFVQMVILDKVVLGKRWASMSEVIKVFIFVLGMGNFRSINHWLKEFVRLR